MKILLKYLKPHKWLVILTLVLATINIGFSLLDPILLGKLVNLAADHKATPGGYSEPSFYWDYRNITRDGKPYLQLGVFYILLFSISVAMVSRIAKAFQDYFLNVVIQKFGARVFTDGLQ
ncbi:MAG: ABC transporter ATP-binding protein, partial [Chitinophagaceae bacterium]